MVWPIVELVNVARLVIWSSSNVCVTPFDMITVVGRVLTSEINGSIFAGSKVLPPAVTIIGSGFIRLSIAKLKGPSLEAIGLFQKLKTEVTTVWPVRSYFSRFQKFSYWLKELLP